MGLWATLAIGISAGLAVAVPLGAMGVLLVTTATRNGRAAALAGAAGIATADLVFATVAATGGAAIAAVLTPYVEVARVVAAAALLAIAAVVAWGALRNAATPSVAVSTRSTFARFLGLTLLNPATIVTFAGVVVALPAELVDSGVERVLFVVGAAGASLTWQAVLALGGLGLRRVLGGQLQRITGVVGAILIAALAVMTLLL